MNSIEKIHNLVSGFLAKDPGSMREGALQMVAGQLAPGFLGDLDDDPAVVDEQIDGLAAFILSHHSDPETPAPAPELEAGAS